MWVWKLQSKWDLGPGTRFWSNPPRTESTIMLIYTRFSSIFDISKGVDLGARETSPRKCPDFGSTFYEKISRTVIWSFQINPPRTESRIILIYPRFSAINDISNSVDLGAGETSPRKIPTFPKFLSQSVGRQSAPDSVLDASRTFWEVPGDPRRWFSLIFRSFIGLLDLLDGFGPRCWTAYLL